MTRIDCLGQCNIYSFVALTNVVTSSFATVAVASIFAANFANVNEPLMFGCHDTQHNDTQHKRAYLWHSALPNSFIMLNIVLFIVVLYVVMLNVIIVFKLLLWWMSLCSVSLGWMLYSLCWVSFFWVSLYWLSLCSMLWRQCWSLQWSLRMNISTSKQLFCFSIKHSIWKFLRPIWWIFYEQFTLGIWSNFCFLFSVQLRSLVRVSFLPCHPF